MAVQRPMITIVDVQRTTPGKLFESEIYLHIWDANEKKLRKQGWIPKDDIDKIEVVTVNDGLEEKTVEVEESIEETTEFVDFNDSEDEDLDDYDLMNINELKKACKDANINFTKKATENSLRNKLRA